ncbi:hypothetical protein HDA32_005733 [Spinactinospora alkalitolerans]|uniref:DUF6879 domain-containing protein n=1 Tax=Spinactinospora alkalitolerans TaxID=687207 RepID=A0A852U6W6_9ACTN|nr:DUF6879 family protein [Spinactinospora alkalitolerans]NYE50613.1 hypothetical protein [Spinactinospora alkalitolerans]
MPTMPASEFAARFPSLFRTSAFRLETLDFYIADNEREPYRRFQSGRSQDLSWRRPWQRTVRGIRENGGGIGRVHIVPDPLTDYLRFELTCAYPASVEAGEDVRVLARASADTLDLPDGEDYWLFDDERSALLRYAPDGEFIDVELVTDPDRVKQHAEWRHTAQAAAVPLHEYLQTAGLTPAH